MGNGLTVWNSMEQEQGDYKTIAHIAPDRTVKFYVDDLPEEIKREIQHTAATSEMTISATQDAPVFSTPPQTPEREPAAISGDSNDAAYPPREVPYIFCEWSESAVFEDKTAYSLSEFDRLMKQADDEHTAMKSAAMSKYGTWQKWYDANDPEYSAFLGYDKVKFTVVMPDGRTFTERQDIGDGNGGVLDFLSQDDTYRAIIPILREAVRKEESASQDISAQRNEDSPDAGGAADAAPKPVPTVREIYERYVPIISDLVLADTAYQNACVNSDQENAYLEGNEAVKRAARTIKDTVFLRLYFDNPTFHNRLHRDVLEKTYPMLSQPQREPSVEDGGEPDTVPYNFELEYRQLSRLQADCEYFLGAGGRAVKHLSEGGIEEQIAKMRELYGIVPEKPEWLTAEDIDRYEARMQTGAVESTVPSDRDAATEAASTSAPSAQPEAPSQKPGAGAPEAEENTDTAPVEPDLAPNADEYLDLKVQHPDKLVGIQVGDYMLFYGKDAEAAAPALGTKLLTREIPGLSETNVTGYPGAWQAVLKKLLEHGQSVVLARPDAEHGPDAPYEIVKERDAADYIPLGMELTIDGRRMKIDSVDFQAGTVSLLDMDLKGWMPIFRSEPISYVREFVEEAQQSEETVAAEMTSQMQESENAQSIQPTPEPPQAPPPEMSEPETVEIDGGKITAPPAPEPPLRTTTEGVYNAGADLVVQKLHTGPERRNFQITDDHLGEGGGKTKYQRNVAAIRTLKQIEAEGRLATPEEQATLSQYTGWGGVASAFDEKKESWAKEYAELKELLTPAENESARGSVLNAHYTTPAVIRAIYDAVGRMDFKPGTVLDESVA